MICIDCPDLPNGVRKREVCCKREGPSLKIGDRVAMPKPMREIYPNALIDNKPTFHPARKGHRSKVKHA